VRLKFAILVIAVVILFLLDLALGSVSIPLKEIINILKGGGEEVMRSIFYLFRLPKSLVALLAGSALSVSGLQMQTLFRNPLAGPYVLGVSSGASLGVSLFVLGLPLLGAGAASDLIRSLGMVGSAWLGAALILAVIMAVSVRIKDIMAILILGMMFGSATSAIVELLQYLSPEGALKSYVVWTMGSLGGVTLGRLGLMSVAVTAGIAISISLIKPLNILLLGENYAVTMGLNVRRARRWIFLGTTLLAGAVTAFCGPIGFIGIAVPHIARMLFSQANHRVLMPATIFIGMAIMLLCDIISQLPGSDAVLPVNTVSALLGIPVVISVIVRNRRIF